MSGGLKRKESGGFRQDCKHIKFGISPGRKTQADLLSWDPVLKLGHQYL